MDEIDAEADGRNKDQTMFVDKDNVDNNVCGEEAWKYLRYYFRFSKC